MMREFRTAVASCGRTLACGLPDTMVTAVVVFMREAASGKDARTGRSSGRSGFSTLPTRMVGNARLSRIRFRTFSRIGERTALYSLFSMLVMAFDRTPTAVCTGGVDE